MDFYDFNGYPQNNRFYGGKAGVKVGISSGGHNYMLKYPGKLRDAGMKNVKLSYSNSPISEYIGCRIFESTGIDVQEVLLGERNGKIVVACRDFLGKGEMLVPYQNIKATFEPAFTDPQGDITNGTGTVLSEIERTLKEHPFLKNWPAVTERFWDQFIVDALIGNPDRNNENWGFIRQLEGDFRLAPVFDCGNALASKKSDRQLEEMLRSEQKLKEEAFSRPCIFEKSVGKRICACSYILDVGSTDCNDAVMRVVPSIDMQKIKQIIDDIPVISDVRAEFLKTTMDMRFENVLKPTYQKLVAAFHRIEDNIHEKDER